MNEDFEREERAFAEALRKDAPVESFRPLDPEALKAAAGVGGRAGRPRWLKGLAAAAAVVVVVGAGAAILPGLVGSRASSVSGLPEVYPAGGAASMDAGDRSSGSAGPATVTNGYAAPAGFRWESYRNVQVQVPDDWGYASAPQSDYCISTRFPTEPYVDLNRGGRAVAAIGCGDALRDDQQAMHLSFTSIDSDPPWSSGSTIWRQVSREVGEARITVTARAGDSELVTRILDSAVVVPAGTDPAGCPVIMPTVPAVGLAGLDGSALTVCLYESDRQRGAFRSSVTLSGTEAAAAWESVLKAPEGGGPNMSATTCGAAQGWPLLLLVGTQKVPVAASVAGCEGNGVADSAAAGGMRSVTRPLCQALMVDPVRIFGGAGTSAALCMR
ncbi:MAG: hypothetical protein ACOH1Y_00100 [Propionicimonas sp.]